MLGGPTAQPGARRRVRASALALAAVVLLALGVVGLLALTPGPASAAPGLPAHQLATSPTITPTVDSSTQTPVPTATVSASTPTATPSATEATPQATATRAAAQPTATVAHLAPGPDTNSGAGVSSGPQPTKLVLAQPTFVSQSGGSAGFSSASFASNGLVVATGLGCVVGVLGIIVAAIALLVLVNSGYGPFLRGLLLGKRAGAAKGRQAGRGGSRAVPETEAAGERAGQGAGRLPQGVRVDARRDAGGALPRQRYYDEPDSRGRGRDSRDAHRDDRRR